MSATNPSDVASYLFDAMLRMATCGAECAAYADSWDRTFAERQLNETWNAEKSERFSRRLTVEELRTIPRSARINLGFANWDENLILIPLWAYNLIANGEQLVCINGSVVTKSVGSVDLDVRAGCIAYGFSPTPSPVIGE